VVAETLAHLRLLIPLRSPEGQGNGGSMSNSDSSIAIEDNCELWLAGTVDFETSTVGLAGWD
jgi:hypothetical protein